MASNFSKPSINSRGLQFYNANGFSPSTVSFALWNDVFITIKISPAKKAEEQSENSVFDYDNSVTTAIPVSKVYDLLAASYQVMDAFQHKENLNVYVSIAGNNLVGYGTMNIEGKGQIYYLAIHKELNDDKIPKISAYYEFNSGFNIINYDNNTGESNTNLVEDTEFNIFITWMREHVKAATKSTAHSVKVALDYELSRIENKLNAIGSAVGARYEGNNRQKKKELFDKPTTENNKSETEFDNDELPF